jgi:hypothetical protein
MEQVDIGQNLQKIGVIEKHWNKTESDRNNNVRRNFFNKPENHKRFKILAMGVFCIENDITPSMLQLGIKHIKETETLLSGRDFTEQDKIVVMNIEDYKEYEMFKKLKAFQEATKNKK